MRGPCNLIGQGWDFMPGIDLNQSAQRLIDAPREWGCGDRKGSEPSHWPVPLPREFPEPTCPRGLIR